MGVILESVPLNIKDLEEIYLIDSFPIPMCQAIRHGRVNLLRDEGAYFGKGTKGWFFGFKLHVLSTNGSDTFLRSYSRKLLIFQERLN